MKTKEHQLALFDYPENHRSRKSDPLSSKAAATEVTTNGTAAKQAGEVLAVVRARPGITSMEIAGYCSLDRYQVARRLPELAVLGFVVRGAISTTGRRAAVTWWPTNPTLNPKPQQSQGNPGDRVGQ